MDKEQLAIARLQDAARLSEHRYKKPLMVTYSGGSLLVGLLMKKCTSKRLTGCSKYEKTKGFKTHLFGTELKLAKKCSTGGWKMAFFPVS